MTQEEFEAKYVNQIVCGDCLDVMKDFPDKCVDLVLTDPPYGIDLDYDVYADTLENLRLIAQASVPEFRRVATRAIVFTGIRAVWVWPASDWLFSYAWRTTGCYGQYGVNQWTPVLCYGKDLPGFGSVNGVIKSNLAYFADGGDTGFSRHEIVENHPCPKPRKIMDYMVKRFSNPGDLILDPFCGSGTTCVAAKKLGRRFIGIEISEQYCQIARERLKAVDTGVPVKEARKGQKALFQ